MTVKRELPDQMPGGNMHIGVWLEAGESAPRFSDHYRVWYWLPPVIWPNESAAMAELVQAALKSRCRNFVLNAPWQIMLFPADAKLQLWAGPFCNTANELAAELLAAMGFTGVIASPELSKKDYTKLPSKSPLPVGLVAGGNWPLCISRTVSEAISPEKPFVSPKGEQAWVRQYGQNYWVYPNWPLDLAPVKDQLKAIGYRVFVHLEEPVPESVLLKQRKGLWNWDIGLK
jgi:putative protease